MGPPHEASALLPAVLIAVLLGAAGCGGPESDRPAGEAAGHEPGSREAGGSGSGPGGGTDPDSGPRPAAASDGPNIVVIVIDTLRADHLSFYGYPEETAPFLAGLARRGVVFERAYSTSSWTAPATASLFTSVHPQQHGVVTGRAVTYLMSDELGAAITLNRIPDELETLPEAMKRAGYRTFGVSDNFNVCPEMGFASGFDRFRSDSRQYLGADHVNGVVEQWHSDIAGGGPYFLYIHYMDPHKPVHARAPWYRPPGATPAHRWPAHLGDPGRRDEVARYDSEIGYVDDRIRRLFELYGWSENTILVVTSDHGEEFWDHGYVNHDKTLFDEVLRIPLLIHDATGSVAPRRVAEPVSILDILPTLAGMTGLPGDARHRGESLLPLMRGAAASPAHGRHLFAHLERHFFRPWGAHETLRGGADGHEHYIALAVMDGPWKLIVDSRDERLLFDRGGDPAETRNLHDASVDMASRLEGRLKEFASGLEIYRSESFEESLSSEEIEKLRSLGYVQ